MKYRGGKFRVMMPGAKVPWPFEPIPLHEACLGESHPCTLCGAELTREGGHLHADDAGKVRRRLCFGKLRFD